MGGGGHGVLKPREELWEPPIICGDFKPHTVPDRPVYGDICRTGNGERWAQGGVKLVGRKVRQDERGNEMKARVSVHQGIFVCNPHEGASASKAVTVAMSTYEIQYIFRDVSTFLLDGHQR